MKFTEIRISIMFFIMSITLMVGCPNSGSSSGATPTPEPGNEMAEGGNSYDGDDTGTRKPRPTPVRPTPTPTPDLTPTPAPTAESSLTPTPQPIADEVITPKQTPTPIPVATSTPRPRQTPAPHVHRWEPVFVEVPIYEEITSYQYKCEMCTQVFNSMEAASLHVLDAGHVSYESDVEISTTIQNTYGYLCKDTSCGFSTTDEAEMIAHAEANSENKEAHSGYTTEKTVLTDVIGFQCNGCDFSTVNEADITIHMASNCSYTSIIETVHQLACNSCGWVGAESMEHTLNKPDCMITEEELILKPMDILYYICKTDTCDIVTTSLDEIKAHAIENHPDSDHGDYEGGVIIDTIEDKIPYYQCNSCGHVAENEETMLAHQAANPATKDHGGYDSNVLLGTEEVPIIGYKCNDCAFTTQSLEEINAHVEQHKQITSLEFKEQMYIGTQSQESGEVKCAGCGETKRQ